MWQERRVTFSIGIVHLHVEMENALEVNAFNNFKGINGGR
jgi:hypothetical protein